MVTFENTLLSDLLSLKIDFKWTDTKLSSGNGQSGEHLFKKQRQTSNLSASLSSSFSAYKFIYLIDD